MNIKKTISLLLIITMILTSTGFVFAEEKEEPNNSVNQEYYNSISSEYGIDSRILRDYISSEANNIPFTITLINPNSDWDAAKIEATSIIKEQFLVDDYIVPTGSTEIYVCDDFRIIELGTDDHLYTEQSNEFAETIAPLFGENGEGPEIRYFNTFRNDNGLQNKSNGDQVVTRGNENSAAWWEANYRYLGTYNGFKFLYSETSIDAESNEVKVGNISSSIDWTKLVSKLFGGTVKRFIGSQSEYINIISSVLSSVMESYQAPISITYGNASSSYVKSQISGDLYHMFVYIRDKNNKIPGYAYYKWGSAERFIYQCLYKVKMPIGYTNTGSLKYKRFTGSSVERSLYTYGYPRNTTSKNYLMSQILTCYYMAGEVTYNEYLKLKSFVSKKLS